MPVEVIHSKTGSSDTDERSSHQNSNMWKLLEENVLRLKNSFPRVIQKTLFGQGKLNLCLSHTFSNTAFGIASNIYSYRNWSFFWNYVLIYSLLCVCVGGCCGTHKEARGQLAGASSPPLCRFQISHPGCQAGGQAFTCRTILLGPRNWLSFEMIYLSIWTGNKTSSTKLVKFS